MPLDNVSLFAGGLEIENFISYRMTSSLYQAADAFSFAVSKTDEKIDISKGDGCTVEINEKLELIGVIDKVSRAYTKQKSSFELSGRDLMGVMMGYHMEQFGTIQEVSPTAMANTLLNNELPSRLGISLVDLKPSETAEFSLLVDRIKTTVPFLSRVDIILGEGNKDHIKIATPDKEEEDRYRHINPSETLFDVIREAAISQGFLFFLLPDGTFVFGQPVQSGSAEFNITRKGDVVDAKSNNVISASFEDDLEPRYSSTTVVAKPQGGETQSYDDIDIKAKVFDEEFPQNFGRVGDFSGTGDSGPIDTKPYVVEEDVDSVSKAAQRAKLLIDKQRFDGFRLSYTVPGHSQNKINWQINKIVHVSDEEFGIDADFLIHERTFAMSKDNGSTTVLELSKLGTAPA